MPYRCTVDAEEQYVRFDLSGGLTQPEIDNAIEDLQTVREKQKLTHVLCVQTDLTVPPDDGIGFRTAEQLSTGPFRGLKLAIVRRESTEERLFEIAANNRGAIVEVFTDEEEAKRWLRST